MCSRLAHPGPAGDNVINAPMDCVNYKEFWVSWKQGVIEVGSGLIVGENRFLHYTHLSPYEVNYIGITTWTGANGYWEINCNGMDDLLNIS